MDDLAGRLAALPDALRELRLGAGYATQRAAASAVRARTGRHVNPASISEWERGASCPRTDRLITYLAGIGSSLEALEAELRQRPVIDIAAMLRGDESELLNAIRHLIRKAGGTDEEILPLLKETLDIRREQ